MTRQRNRPSFHPLARYVCVGAVCAVGQTMVIIGGDRLGYHYGLCATVGTILFGAVGYALHSRFTYQARMHWLACGRFIMGLASGYLLSLALLALLTDVLAIPMIVTAPVTTIIVALWGFIASRWAILLPKTSFSPFERPS